MISLRRPRRRILALTLASALIFAATVSSVMWAPVTANAATASDINRNLASYVLFGVESLSWKGGNGSPGHVLGGNVGVNYDPNPADNTISLNVGANGRFIMSDGTQLVGGSIRLGEEASVDTAFVGTQAGSGWGYTNPTTGPTVRTEVVEIDPLGDLPIVPASQLTTAALCGPIGTAGTAEISVGGNNNPQSLDLQPGAYKSIRVQNGATLTLGTGVYTIERFHTGQNTTIYTVPGTILHITGDGDPNANEFTLGGNGSYFGAAPGEAYSVALICVDDRYTNNHVQFSDQGTFHGVILAPNTTINAGRGNRHFGRFLGLRIASDFNTDIEYRTVTPAASLGNRVWDDANHNGVQDDGEAGIEGITVELLNANGDVLATRATSATGFYLFTGLAPGDYRVRFTTAGHHVTIADVSGDTVDTVDSDADADGLSRLYALAAGEQNLTVDAGLIPYVAAIDIEKATNGEDADDVTGPRLAAGETVTWSYVVENTGDFDLYDVVVTDDNGTSGDDTDDWSPTRILPDLTGNDDDVLEVGERWSYQRTGTATVGQYTNVGEVTALAVATDAPVSDDDPSHYLGIEDTTTTTSTTSTTTSSTTSTTGITNTTSTTTTNTTSTMSTTSTTIAILASGGSTTTTIAVLSGGGSNLPNTGAGGYFTMLLAGIATMLMGAALLILTAGRDRRRA